MGIMGAFLFDESEKIDTKNNSQILSVKPIFTTKGPDFNKIHQPEFKVSLKEKIYNKLNDEIEYLRNKIKEYLKRRKK